MRIRVGVVGCGAVAQIMHLPYLRTLSELFELTALCDLSPGLLDRLGPRYGVPPERRFTDFRALLDTDLDAVLVLNSGSHAPAVLAALAAGKHVFTEKPLCFTQREAGEIERAAAAAGRVVMVGYMKRFDPGFRHGANLVGKLTSPRYAQITVLHPSEQQYFDIHGVERCDDVPDATLRALRQATADLLDEAVGSVGDALRFVYDDVFLGSMVHDTNVLRALLGAPRHVALTEIWPPGSTAPTVTTVLEHDDDLRTLFTWTYLDEVRDYAEEIAVFAPTGRVRIQFASPFLKHWPTPVVTQSMEDGALVERRVQVSFDEAFQAELRAFHDCAAHGAPVLTDVADARADIALLQRIFAAHDPAGLGGEAALLR
ncbi:Gfo/Idh/MocA family protein [Saccharomonospora xinjiangensis]|uniref:Gfo/Idh/MocA family protein n=1 Tax=Saccharomonospora xinjiangensis TaxID=75294 RepID=UPI003510BD57